MKPDLETQIQFEKLYDKNQLIPHLRGEFIDNEEIKNHCKLHGIPHEFAVSLLVQMVIHKRTTVAVLVGLLKRHFEDQEHPAQACADMLLKAADCDLVDFSIFGNQRYVDYKDIGQIFILRKELDVTQDVYDDLDKYQYPLPCLIPPAEVKNNKDTGYYSMKGSVILKNGNHHNDDTCVDHLNCSNNVALSINPDVARMVANKWRNLDKPQEGEEAKDYQKRVAAFEKYDRSARDVMDHLYVYGNKFYLTHKYDKRGRTYAQGYHVNSQGTPWNRSVIEFAHQEVPSNN